MDTKKERQGGFEHIGDILHGLIGSLASGFSADLMIIERDWDGAVGEETAKNARPVSLERGVLLVNVTAPAWIQQLHFSKKEIIEKINRAAGKTVVHEIRFKVGPVEP